MKTKTVSLMLILCIVFSVFALASCEKRGETTETAAENEMTVTDSDGTADGTTAEATTDKWEEPALAIRKLSARDRQLKIECSSRQTAVKASKTIFT